MKPELIFSDENENIILLLQQAFKGYPELKAVVMKPDELPIYEIDAIFLTLIAAERWGPSLEKYKSQILKTHSQDGSMPPYVITGIALNPDDPNTRDPKGELTLVMESVFNAIDSFNGNDSYQIRSIGFWTDMLGINRLNINEVGQLIRSIYERRY